MQFKMPATLVAACSLHDAVQHASAICQIFRNTRQIGNHHATAGSVTAPGKFRSVDYHPHQLHVATHPQISRVLLSTSAAARKGADVIMPAVFPSNQKHVAFGAQTGSRLHLVLPARTAGAPANPV
ncbi:protein of unknown function [Georgfuchsia toluolica]|uniref:Uncharacterized protein n=1 Tax=Georgfuchsia toluolica TaxID=424218 RepID=A0A916J2E9_9PROT|nr:protein of unknown function [Georgfuchsia toluolica]